MIDSSQVINLIANGPRLPGYVVVEEPPR
jgi:hypothetical protein